MQLKILNVVPGLLPEAGGPSRTVPGLCEGLTAAGAAVTLFSTHQAGKDITVDPASADYEVCLFRGTETSLRSAREIYQTIKKRARDFDLVHVHSLWNQISTVACAAARSASLPYVLAPLGMLSTTCVRQRHFAHKRIFAALYDRRTVEGAARLHLASADELETLVKGWFRYPPHFIARNGTAPVTSFAPGAFRRRFPELKERRLMLFFGRLHPIKGLDLQLEALGLLKQKYEDLMWVLVGPDAGEWNRLKGAIQTRGLQDHVRWVGPLMGDERFAALADADVLVHTSFYESQAMTINEALAVGVPLVITDSVKYDDVSVAGAGRVVPRNATAVAAAIDSILQDAAASAAMREAGRRFAAAEFSWTRIAETIIKYYEEILSEKQSELSYALMDHREARANS